MKKIVIVALTLFIVSCNQDSQKKESNQVNLPTALPSMTTDGLCVQPTEIPEICDWVGSVDTIFTGTIVSIEASYDHFWVKQNGQTFIDDSCPEGALVSSSMIIKININEIFYGNLDPYIINNMIEIRVGPSNFIQWNPTPDGENYGPITWSNNSNPLPTGSFLGIAATKVPNTDYLSLMGALPFTVDQKDHLVLPQHDNCDLIKWPDLEENVTIQSFKELILTCENPSNTLKTIRIGHWNENPTYSYAASCYAEHLNHIEPNQRP